MQWPKMDCGIFSTTGMCGGVDPDRQSAKCTYAIRGSFYINLRQSNMASYSFRHWWRSIPSKISYQFHGICIEGRRVVSFAPTLPILRAVQFIPFMPLHLRKRMYTGWRYSCEDQIQMHISLYKQKDDYVTPSFLLRSPATSMLFRFSVRQRIPGVWIWLQRFRVPKIINHRASGS